MDAVFIEAFVIGFVGAILFLAVDKFERNGSLAVLLKLLVLVVGGMAILHKLAPPCSASRCSSALWRRSGHRLGSITLVPQGRPLSAGAANIQNKTNRPLRETRCLPLGQRARLFGTTTSQWKTCKS